MKRSNTFIRNISENGEWEIEHSELHMHHVIGEGSFGIVRLAEWRGTDVALKVINDKTLDTNEFDIEMMIISKLHHPNILQFLGSCTSKVPYIIVMEYMPNNSLEFNIKNNNLNYERKINIIKDISKGLAYLHNRKPQCIIHRDLKPSNILLTISYKAKIADFGISSLQAKCSEDYKMTGETGTYRYMAPEVMKHMSYSTKVDIWSFGMIVYHLFVEVPYGNLQLESIFKCIIADTIPINYKMLELPLKTLIDNTVVIECSQRWDSIYLVNYCNNDLNIIPAKIKTFICK
jgi:serine/threonine protein kinase